MTSQRVAAVDSVPEDGRLHLQVEGRYVSLVRAKGVLSCIDSVCFHAGGPLTLGDIEELEGTSCIICPWHYYKISLDTGEKFYQGLEKDAEGKLVPGEWKSVGRRQRVHKVEERPDGIYIALQQDGELASDAYATKHECGDRVLKGHAAHVPGYSMPEDAVAGSSIRSSSLKTPPLGFTSGEGEDFWPEDIPEPTPGLRMQ